MKEEEIKANAEFQRLTLEQKTNVIFANLQVIKSRIHQMPCEDHVEIMRKHTEKIERHEAFINKLLGGIIVSNVLTCGLTFLLTKIFTH
jgi:hypothetical protein